MKQEYLLLTGALRVFSNFNGKSSTKFIYDYQNKLFVELIQKYRIDTVAGNASEIDKALNLLKWCSKNVLHNGGTKDVEFVPKTSIGILDYSFQKGREYGVYCRLQAIVFTECCLALGIKARILHCLPFSPYDFDTHVVSMVYIKDMDKWVLLDAGNNRYFVDEQGNILSPLEARNRLGNQEFIECNVPDENYKSYMAKNLFYFKSPKINTFGADLINNQETIYCVPEGFDVLSREIAYCEYAIKNSPAHLVDDWKTALTEAQSKESFTNLNSNDFFAI